MGLFIFRLPDVGEGIAAAEVVAWHVSPGQLVEEDAALVDVMTDKATVEMTSPVTGRVLAIHGEVGEFVPVGSPLVEFATEGNDDEAPASQPVEANRPVREPAPAAATSQAGETKAGSPAPETSVRAAQEMRVPAREAAARPLASPATRRRAYERGIPLQFVPGSGPGGRITAADLDAFVAAGGVALRPMPARRDGINEVRIIGLRRRIAERMQEAKRRIPHFSYVEEFDLTELEALRGVLNEGRKEDQPKLTLLPFFMLAIVTAVPEFPQVNARYDDEAGILRTYEGVHIGIATQTPGGLTVPVVRHAEARDLWDNARELVRVTTAAREDRATREELSGSTITLTSLGALGGIAATPVINYPEVAILGPNRLVQRPVVVDGRIAVRTMMNMSASFDHRIVDGHDAARFVQRIRHLVERPALLFVDRG